MKLFIVTLILFIILPVFSQNTGYLGKLNTISFRIQPSADLTINTDYRARIFETDKTESKFITLTNFFEASYYRVIKRNIKLGGGIGYGKVKLRANNEFIRNVLYYNKLEQQVENYFEANNLEYENIPNVTPYPINYSSLSSLEMNRIYVELAVEFSKKKSLILGNLTQRIGLRYGRATFENKEYKISAGDINQGYEYVPVNIKELIVDFETKKFNDIQLIYNVALHKPITSALILRYGVSLALGPYTSKSHFLYRYKSDAITNSNNTSIYSENRLEYFYKRTIFSNPFSLDFGLIFAF